MLSTSQDRGDNFALVSPIPGAMLFLSIFFDNTKAANMRVQKIDVVLIRYVKICFNKKREISPGLPEKFHMLKIVLMSLKNKNNTCLLQTWST